MRFAWLALLLVLACCVQQPPAPAPVSFPGAAPITPISVNALPGWAADDTATALAAFVRSCKALALMPPDQALGGAGIAKQAAGTAGAWQNACNGAQDATPGNPDAARKFFEAFFVAYSIDGNASITGYFEPQYPGAKNLAPGYTVPLYAKPADPALANLPRAAIDHNALYRKAPVTAYVTNPVDAYMLQVYGAGRILLPNGHTLRVGFDGQNNSTYTPIGGILVAAGDLASNDVSFQSISAWLKSHPAQAQSIMEQNARYVYLRPLGALPDDEGAPGALGVPLTAGRSVAIDPTAIPLGMPVFLATTNPITNAPLNRLAIAQDTDAGIHGATEAKLFFGAGPDAEATAGGMRQSGHLYILVPRPTA